LNPFSKASTPQVTREYLIDNFRVSFMSGADWRCACHEFAGSRAGSRACRHTREAAGMREAQAQIKTRVQSGTSGLRVHARRRA
jgi:hypothetical protein